jgi:hypothetical protein
MHWSELGYSELVQRLFEKMTFFHQTPYLVSLSKDAVDECIATVNGTLVIPHPTADDQPKYIACKTGVSLHMAMPKNLVEGNRYELDFCNRLHACRGSGR